MSEAKLLNYDLKLMGWACNSTLTDLIIEQLSVLNLRNILNDNIELLYILSGAVIPNNPIELEIAIAVAWQSCKRRFFFSSLSALMTEYSV